MQPNTERLLVLIHPDQATPMWLNIWARSYPHSLQIPLCADNNTSRQLHDTWQKLPSDQPIFIVIHQTPAFIDWYYNADWLTRRRIIGIIWQAPPFHDVYAEQWQRIRFDCPTALVLPNDPNQQTFAQQHTQHSGARTIIAPEAPQKNWQWGMKLMQEMIMAS